MGICRRSIDNIIGAMLFEDSHTRCLEHHRCHVPGFIKYSKLRVEVQATPIKITSPSENGDNSD